MEHKQGLERQLKARVEAMQREKLQSGEVHLDPDPAANAELTDFSPPEFGKGT
ncbi:MAG: hypothetical protein QG636_636 [Patescibacteria group bacterium]|nr:hypothetical protein [Patescibacteria group bacterium]